MLYIGLGITTILVLRLMSQRFRRGEGSADSEVPYGPSEPASEQVKEPVG